MNDPNLNRFIYECEREGMPPRWIKRALKALWYAYEEPKDVKTE